MKVGIKKKEKQRKCNWCGQLIYGKSNTILLAGQFFVFCSRDCRKDFERQYKDYD